MMKKSITALLFVFLGTSVGVQAAGNPEAGQAKVAVCAGCHGANGNSTVPMFPKLAEQGQRYLIKQIHDIKSGKRVVPQMTGLLNGLSDQDIQNIAAYYHAQKRTPGVAKKDLVEKGRQLFKSGNKSVGIPACMGCHGATGNGIAEAGYPSLWGQQSAYTATQLKAFRSGKRTNDGTNHVMKTVTFRMRNDEISALASYISGLH